MTIELGILIGYVILLGGKLAFGIYRERRRRAELHEEMSEREGGVAIDVCVVGGDDEWVALGFFEHDEKASSGYLGHRDPAYLDCNELTLRTTDGQQLVLQQGARLLIWELPECRQRISDASNDRVVVEIPAGGWFWLFVQRIEAAAAYRDANRTLQPVPALGRYELSSNRGRLTVHPPGVRIARLWTIAALSGLALLLIGQFVPAIRGLWTILVFFGVPIMLFEAGPFRSPDSMVDELRALDAAERTLPNPSWMETGKPVDGPKLPRRAPSNDAGRST